MSRVVVTIEHRYERTPDGSVWASFFTYPFWTRYLDVFDSVRVVSRVRCVHLPTPGWARVDGDGVHVWGLPYYVGPWQYLAKMWRVRRGARAAIDPSDAVILRIDSQVAAGMESLFRRTGHPFGVEVVVDPYDVFAPGSGYPLRSLWRAWFPAKMRRQCRRACATAYVTERALQRRYPPLPGAFTTHYSSVELGDGAFAAESRRPPQGSVDLLFVGTLDHLRKAPDVLLDAVASCVGAGLDLRLVMIGGGAHQPALERLADTRGIRDRVDFRGQLRAGDDVRKAMDTADIFVLPSRGEGLPRAAIEAMARGLPVVGSTVGGYPELLEPEDMVPPGDAAALAAKIRDVVTDPERMARSSARNLTKARDYHEDVLRCRRVAFYRTVKERTEEWLTARR